MSAKLLFKNYTFDSKLEARWAVFFESIGLPWDYKPELFDLGAAGLYEPSFRVEYPFGGFVYFHVVPDLAYLSREQKKKVAAFPVSPGPLIILDGPPALRRYVRVLKGEFIWGYFEADIKAPEPPFSSAEAKNMIGGHLLLAKPGQTGRVREDKEIETRAVLEKAVRIALSHSFDLV